MCSKPKVPKQKPPKPVQYLRNPFLDGAAIGAEGAGRDGLRIDLGDTADTGYRDPLDSVYTGKIRRGGGNQTGGRGPFGAAIGRLFARTLALRGSR